MSINYKLLFKIKIKFSEEESKNQKSDGVARRIVRKRTIVRDERSNAANASLF